MIARELGMDPLEFRLKNVIRSEEDAGGLGDRFHGPLAADLLERLRTELRWDQALPDGHGRGVALLVMHIGTAGPTTLKVRLRRDGQIQVITGFPEQGGGQAQTIRRVIAAAASVDEARISIVRRTTKDAPLDPGVGGSWATHMASPAARQLGEQVRDWLEERVPRALPGTPHAVELQRDWLVDAATGERLLGFREAVERLIEGHETVEFSATYTPTVHAPGEPGNADFAAFGVELAVDPETGAIRILDAVVIADVGVVINPVAHAGQLEGGFAFGIGAALMEEIVMESGVVVGPTLAETKLPTIRDVPPLRIVHVQAATGPGAFGAKAAGELTNSQIAPAIANAVADATGARIVDLPLTPERVLVALRELPATTA
jgi:CO/xanthine dehydrogenase Mo-binding subunit